MLRWAALSAADGSWCTTTSRIYSPRRKRQLAQSADFSYSLGFYVGKDGKLGRRDRGLAGLSVGVGAGDETGRGERAEVVAGVLRAAVKAAQGSDQPIELLVENAQFFKTYSVDLSRRREESASGAGCGSAGYFE